MKLGIVGHGFVGTAVDHGFTKDVQKFIVDPKHNSTNTIEDLIAFKPDATFVAVPTPQLETGECNTAILEDVMQQLNRSKGLLVIVWERSPENLQSSRCRVTAPQVQRSQARPGQARSSRGTASTRARAEVGTAGINKFKKSIRKGLPTFVSWLH